MTTDEAIRILDPETSHNALVEMMGGRWNQPQAMELLQEAQRMGLQALRAQQTGGWISVKDRLPEERSGQNQEFNVMVKGFSRATALCYMGNGAWEDDIGAVTTSPTGSPCLNHEGEIPMKLPVCPFDMTYCTNADCRNTKCERHPRVLESLKDDFARTGHPISVSDFSGICRKENEHEILRAVGTLGARGL